MLGKKENRKENQLRNMPDFKQRNCLLIYSLVARHLVIISCRRVCIVASKVITTRSACFLLTIGQNEAKFKDIHTSSQTSFQKTFFWLISHAERPVTDINLFF